MDQAFRVAIRMVLRTVYPAMRVLRLCDRDGVGMDKLFYFVRQADNSFAASTPDLNEDVEYFENHAVLRDDEDLGDDDVFEDSDDEESVDGGYPVPGDEHLGNIIQSHWEYRREKLVHDYSICGKFVPQRDVL